MVYTYSATRSSDSDSTPGQGSGESSTLLTHKLESAGHATISSCIGNLSNTIIGSGMLTFPLAMATQGIMPGMISCLLSGGVAAFGLYLLSLCATKTQHRQASFFAVAQLTYPRAAVFFDAAVAIKCFGVSISYLIIIKGLMPSVVASVYHDLTSPDTNPPAWALKGTSWLLIFMAILFPLCFLRRIDSLRHTSYIALFAAAYLVVIVITCYFRPMEGMPPRGQVHLIHFTPKFLTTFPVQVFAFTCAQNLFPLYNEVRNNTQSRMNIIIGGAVGGAAMTYVVIAVFGYLTFGDKVGANIIAMYPSTSLFIAIGQLAIVILVLFSYPLQVLPCRYCLDKVFDFSDEHATKGITEDDSNSNSDSDSDSDSDTVQDSHGESDMSTTKHVLLTVAIVILGFTVAFMVDSLEMVLSIVGCTGSTTISFILPGLFYWKVSRGGGPGVLRWGAVGLIVYGTSIFVTCLGFSMYQMVDKWGAVHL